MFSALGKKIHVEIIWFVYSSERYENLDSSEIVLHSYDYDNALEVLKENKPDIVFAYAGGPQGQIHYALSSASKFLNIPVISIMTVERFLKIKRSKYMKQNISRFFENQIPTEKDKAKKVFMKRGKFFLYKTNFLYKTLRVIKKERIEIWKDLMQLFFAFFKIQHDFDAKYANTLHLLLDGEEMFEPLVKSGFKSSSLVITGNPLYDEAFQKIKKFSNEKRDNKIRILLVTSPVVEHGRWTKQQRNDAVKSIVQNIIKNQTMDLIIKIHPVTESIVEYESILQNMNAKISVFQEGDILDYLEKCDIVITYDSETTASIFALISRKPIIVCNFYNTENDRFVNRGLALECKNAPDISKIINNANVSNPATEEKINEFVKEFLYKADGQASERVSEAIIDLIKK